MSTGNLDLWRFYMKDITSPDSYIDMGFYYMINACLQRRVWLGSIERPCFPNLYVLLVGKASVGKTQVIKPVTDFLTFHKAKHRLEPHGSLCLIEGDKPKTDEAMEIVDEVASHNKSTSSMFMQQKNLKEVPLVFPVSADSITYEALIMDHSSSTRFFPVKELVGDTFKTFVRAGKYKHCSLNFLLEEISTLFRKKTGDVCKYLLKAYDCGDYTHKTKGGGIDIVTNMCLNILGGTVPDFVGRSADDDLINDGFISRSIIVYGEERRFERFEAIFTDEQKMAKIEILRHLFKLSKLFGQVSFSPEAHAFMTNYVEKVLPANKVNKDPKLDTYYGRKALHARKMAMSMHFADQWTSMEIQLESCLKAIAILDKLEINMHLALGAGTVSPVGKCTQRILETIRKKGPQNDVELMLELVMDFDPDLIVKSIIFLKQAEKIITKDGKYAIKI